MRQILLAGLLIAGLGCASTRVPDLLDQTRTLAPQAVTSVDISDDGNSVAVTTLAFRHHPNFWVLSNDGDVRFGRAIAPWAPFQGAALDSGKAFGAGLAYSRVTSPYPTIALFEGEKDVETLLEDSQGERGWLRYGEGDWRTGWLRSLMGDLLVRAGDGVITVRGHSGAVRLRSDGRRENFPLRERPYRMTASANGAALAFGYIASDRTPLVSVVDAATGAEAWKFSAADPPAPPPLPDPSLDFPELSERFNLKPDGITTFRVAASVAPSADGSSVAVAEYVGRLWVRRRPAIGKWNPPYHEIPFVPRQRGRLRIVTSPGRETVRVDLPVEGLFDLRVDRGLTKVWAFPQSWFARGMAGSAWLPADDRARAVYEFDVSTKEWKTLWTFPDAVAHVAIHPDGDRAWASCWDGKLSLLRRDGRVLAAIDASGPARLAWSRDGRWAAAGTDRGEVIGLDGAGAVRWRKMLPVAEPSPAEPAKPVFDGIPVYAVGRTGKEHAYVGDIWLVKTAAGGFLVDGAGSSSIPQTILKINAAGVELKDVRHLLHSHSHGDHSGGAYLWRSMGLTIVAPESASIALSWLMPMLSDYGVWVPRPVDVPLRLRRAGDEAEFTAAGLRIRAIFVPGHSFDSVLYLMELNGKRVVFTGDIGFQAPSDILHRCWGDTDHAAVVTEIVRTKVLPFRPDVVFTGHGGRIDGTGFLEDLVKRSEESILKAKSK